MDVSIYVRPDKPLRKPVQRRNWINVKRPSFDTPKPVVVDSATECHVTPPIVASRMVDYLEPGNGPICEPHGGTGALVQALLDHGVCVEQITTVERHVALSQHIEERFDHRIKVVNNCFLEYGLNTKDRFKHIILNPPFKTWKKHVLMAKSLLCDSSGSSLVALVPASFDLEGFEVMETLPFDTFQWAKVRTKIVLLQR